MTVVAGYAPDKRGPGALHLAAMLCRSSGDDLVVAVVVPRSWFPSMARIDAEYRESLGELVEGALAQARTQAPADVATSFVSHEAGSVPAGLLELADQHHARLVVLGSSAAGMFGHIALGSVTDHLVHASPVPVALATRGFRTGPGATVRRVTVAYGRSQDAEAVVRAASPVTDGNASSLRLATFAVWSRPAYTMRLGTEGEDAVLSEWVSDTRAAAETTLAGVRELAEQPRDVESVVGVGRTWSEALEDVDWHDGDVVVVGSSSHGPAARVFLGARATKIVRHSPVPVVVVPRAAT
jgi:nucleotide-binding universal stress UspA family protein